MTKRGSTKRWLQRQSTDPFVKQRKQQGLRSRAAFKLDELIAKDRPISAGGKVVDLGAAPGGWAQRMTEIVGPKGTVVAVDLLEMAPIAGVNFIQGDICDPETISQVVEIIGKNDTDLVLSGYGPQYNRYTRC